MKVLVVFLACILGALCKIPDPKPQPLSEQSALIYEDEAHAAIESLRQLLLAGIPSLRIPPLDPLNIETISIDLGGYGFKNISGTVSLQKVSLVGVAGWDTPDIKIKPTIFPIGAKYNFGLFWQKIFGEIERYSVNANVLGHKIVGEGSGQLNLEELAITADGTAGLPIQIRTLNIHAALANSELTMGTLTLDDVDLTALITSIVNGIPGILEQSQELLDRLAEVLKNVINELL